jgi:hypothetical protein
MFPRAPRTHAIVGALVCVVLPAATWLDRSIGPAWSMFTSSASYRLRIVAVDASGARRTLAPTALYPKLTPAAGAPIAGSDHWRHGELPRLAGSLPAFARLACDLGRPTSLTVTLEERVRPDDAVHTTVATVTCAQ